MEKIFLYNKDIDKTAYMNWRVQRHQPIYDMMIIADGYMKAAIMLAQDCLQDIMKKWQCLLQIKNERKYGNKLFFKQGFKCKY